MLNGDKSLISAADNAELKTALFALVEPLVKDHGAELVEVELNGGKGNELVRLLVHTDAGVTLALCESVSREVADLFDVEDPISGRYRLEVTSPGLDRPLASNGDFARANGRMLKIVLKSGHVVKGRLAACVDDHILLDDQTSAIVRADIAKAHIEPEL